MNQLNKKVELKCKIHKQFDIQYACLSTNSKNPLSCQVCTLRNQMDHYFISIPEVIMQKDTLPIQNWPLGIDQEALDFLAQHSLTNKKEQIQSRIHIFYKELTSQILQTIENSEKQSLHELEKCSYLENDLMKFYNLKFQRDKLKEIFQQQDDQREQQYQQLLTNLDSTKENNLKELTEKIKFFEDIDNKISFDQSYQIKLIANQLISKINFFSSDLIDQQQLDQEEEEEDQQIDINNLGISLVKNISKYSDIKQQIQHNLNKIQKKYKENSKNLEKFINEVNLKIEEAKIQQFEGVLQLIQQTQENILANYYNLDEQEITEDRKYLLKIVDQYRQLDQNQKKCINQIQNIDSNQQLSLNYFQDFLFLINKNKENNSILKLFNELNQKINDVKNKIEENQIQMLILQRKEQNELPTNKQIKQQQIQINEIDLQDEDVDFSDLFG